MKKLSISEKEIEKQILEYLKYRHDVFVWRNNSVGIFDPSKKTFRRPSKYHLNGVSDILGIVGNGKFLAIEVKSSKGRLSEAQAFFLKEVEKRGGYALIARSLNDVVAFLDNVLPS